MAHKKADVVRIMVENSGKTPEEISISINKEPDYVAGIIDGSVKRVMPNTLNLIAERCGYDLAFVRGDEVLVLAAVDIPVEDGTIEIAGRYPGTEFEGKEVSVTGKLYGLNDESQRSVFESLGATWVSRFKKRTSDILIVGTNMKGKETGQVAAAKSVTNREVSIIDADDFRDRFIEVTGIDISAQ